MAQEWTQPLHPLPRPYFGHFLMGATLVHLLDYLVTGLLLLSAAAIGLTIVLPG